MKTHPFFPILALFLTLAGALPCPADSLRVSAAASLAEVLGEIDAAFTQETGTKVQLNLGASSLLARQIEEGAPVDLFISADEARMDGLEKQGLIDPATRRPLLSNSLTVVVPADSALVLNTISDLVQPGIRRIATGDPNTVPVGIYAKEHLQNLKIWTQLQPRIIAMENVRSALAAVESGNADAGIVYKTDAAISKKVKIACEVPAAEGPRIIYPVAVLKSSKNPLSSRAYVEFLRSASARESFGKFGFVLLPEKSSGPTASTTPAAPAVPDAAALKPIPETTVPTVPTVQSGNR
ncbi:MAG: modA [Verrucomicrobiales bacterium]|nr:modA [Verrucomicrobiales bacterium]